MKKWITILGIAIAILAVLVSSSLAKGIDFSNWVSQLINKLQPALAELPQLAQLVML
ncbi:MAG: hypothetical protein AAGC88_06525 [Bacteroidota bacterium]